MEMEEKEDDSYLLSKESEDVLRRTGTFFPPSATGFYQGRRACRILLSSGDLSSKSVLCPRCTERCILQ
jgi:hypothetical protein